MEGRGGEVKAKEGSGEHRMNVVMKEKFKMMR